MGFFERDIKDLEKSMYKEEEIDISAYHTLKVSLDIITPNIKQELPKPYTREEMIEKLKDNNLKFEENEELECMNLLKSVSYYNMKHFISEEFGKTEEKNYTDIMALYNFDRFLVKWLFGIINKLEVHLRTVIVDVFLLEVGSQKYGAAAFYLDKGVYFEETPDGYKIKSRDKQKYNRVRKLFKSTIDKNKNTENIKYNIDKYGVVPAWVIFEYFTLGDLSSFIYAARNKSKVSGKISEQIDRNFENGLKIPSDMLAKWLNSIRHLRNRVSHTDIIYGRNLEFSPPQHSFFEEYNNKITTRNYKSRLISFLLAMKVLYMSMNEADISYWNQCIDELGIESQKSDVIKLSRLGILEDDLSVLKINEA